VILRYQPLKKLSSNSAKDIATDKSDRPNNLAANLMKAGEDSIVNLSKYFTVQSSKMYWLLGSKSQLSIKNKLLLRKVTACNNS